MTKIEMTETVLCDIRFRECNLFCLFLTLVHWGFEFVSDFEFRHFVLSFSVRPLTSEYTEIMVFKLK